MIIVDAHCDTITKIMEDGTGLRKNNCHIDIERLKSIGNYVQFFAAFIDPSYCQAYPLKRALQIIDEFYSQIEANKDDIMTCRNYNDIEEAVKSGKIAAVLSIEGGEALQGDLGVLRMLYKLGVRSICLTWNYRNEIADGVKDESSGGGLTPFGRKVIKEMNELGMIIDLSHISKTGFWDVLECTSAPVIVSHSNAQKLCPHRRNLTDKQILAIKDNGGVIGVNLYPEFLNNSKEATLKDVINHIEYISSLVGPEHIGLGADFDGIESVPTGINGVQDIEKIFNELAKLNYSNENIEKFAGKNFLRVIQNVL
ncbi:dipeptidase [Acetivibrio mesophilus]|uniref:Membrane dipeptidase n=1 Tax=Acetivibrio mesophilus TaxID=2487273 RepID=A0A4Q0I2K6_9FIRM|nr:dipeptidase [Acetivibrio mesophilus]ODM25391.1 peptidase [Clostridium sp. Bc-iso-3]RXE58470.1 membrane dipeptidase [Acetivibrio mesophilus]HHV29821.1 membrane dipeptidase [Clostridium sp.]